MASVIHLNQFDHRRRERLPTALERAVWSQELCERIIAKAAGARRRDFERALGEGVSVDDLAVAVGLDVRDVRAIVAGRKA